MHRSLLRWLTKRWQNLSTGLRSAYYRSLLGAGGQSLQVYGPICIHHPERLTMGADCTINHWCVLNARAPLTIGNRVRLSAGCIVSTAGLDTNAGTEGLARRHGAKSVTIEDDVWIGAGAIILPGVTIGRGSIIGAGAVVTRDVPPGTVAVGVPARARAA